MAAAADIVVVMAQPVLPSGEVVRLTRSAVAQYHAWVRPSLFHYQAAADELDRALGEYGELTGVPEWVRPAQHGEGLADVVEWWAMLGQDVAFPLADGFATTCVVRGCISPKVRAHRREIRARRAASVRERPVLGFKRSGDRIGRRPLHEFASDDLRTMDR